MILFVYIKIKNIYIFVGLNRWRFKSAPSGLGFISLSVTDPEELNPRGGFNSSLV